MQVMLVDSTATVRPAVEDFIRAGYARKYGAKVGSLPATLFAIAGADGAPLAAAGLRLRGDGFFSEAYLDAPLEMQAFATLGKLYARDEFLEVTTLVSASPFALFPLMSAMLRHGRERGLRCGVFTATAPLRKLFTRLGIPFVPVLAAAPERIGSPESWGSYYEQDPWVCLMPNPAAPATCLLPRTRTARPSNRETALNG